MSAPARSKAFKQSCFPWEAANINAVKPLELVALISARFSSKTSKAAVCPLFAASINAVCALGVAKFTPAPARINAAMQSV